VKEQQLGLFSSINRPSLGQRPHKYRQGEQGQEWEDGIYLVFYKGGAWCVDEMDGRSVEWIMKYWPKPTAVLRLEDGEDVIERAFEVMRQMGVEPA
jgi:hypothetical protein